MAALILSTVFAEFAFFEGAFAAFRAQSLGDFPQLPAALRGEDGLFAARADFKFKSINSHGLTIKQG